MIDKLLDAVVFVVSYYSYLVVISSFGAFSQLSACHQIPVVTPSAVPVLPTLSVLRLGSNLLMSLSDGSFSACPALTELHLRNNRISSLSDDTFSGLSKLEVSMLASRS